MKPQLIIRDLFWLVLGLLVIACGMGGWAAIELTDNPMHRERVAADIRFHQAIRNGNPNRKDSINRIEKAIVSNYHFESLCGIVAARNLGPKGAFALDELLLVYDRDHETKVIRREVMLALCEIGPPATEAIPVIIDAVTNDSGDVAWFAAEALGKIGVGTPEVTTALEKASKSDDQMLSKAAVTALKKLTQP